MYTYIIRLVIVVRFIASQTSLWGSPTWGFDYQLLIFYSSMKKVILAQRKLL